MGDTTKVNWADKTFSPWFGCTQVSAACDHCYAMDWANLHKMVQWGPHAERRRASDAYYRQTAKWQNHAVSMRERPRVFPSLCDPFDNHKSIKQEWRNKFYATIAATPNLDWLLLTKRPQNVRGLVPIDWLNSWPANVWVGVTVENQEEHDRRMPHLRAIPAPVRFLSMEPLLGPVELDLRGIHWVIAGGESGREARPTHPNWIRSVRDQCAEADVPFLMKQWGEFMPADSEEFQMLAVTEKKFARMSEYVKPTDGMYRVGTNKSGRMLDGQLHHEFPRIAA